MMKTIHKKYAVIVSQCFLAPGMQAVKDGCKSARPLYFWGCSFIQCLLENHIDIISFPCPESSYNGYQNGLCRKTHGVAYYEKDAAFCGHCRKTAENFAAQIEEMTLGGYVFLAFLGVENSPTCAVTNIYSNKGTLKRQGIFVSALQSELKKRGIEIEYTGVYRRGSGKALKRLTDIIGDKDKEGIGDEG